MNNMIEMLEKAERTPESLQQFISEHEVELLALSPEDYLEFDDAVSELFDFECAIYDQSGHLVVEVY